MLSHDSSDMDNPFEFDTHATRTRLVGIDGQVERVVGHVKSLKNLLLVSPRGWGKRSVVKEVEDRISIKQHDYIFCQMDLSGIKTTSAFVSLLIQQISMVPAFGICLHDEQWHDDLWTEIPEMAGTLQHARIILCISEFQNILSFAHSIQFQKKLANCLSSRSHTAILGMATMSCDRDKFLEAYCTPLRLVLKTLHIRRPDLSELAAYIRERFRQSGKEIAPSISNHIPRITRSIPHYCMVFAWHCWARTRYTCTLEIIKGALEHYLRLQEPEFMTITLSLTSKQSRFLLALSLDEFPIYSAENIKRNNLGSTGHVARLVKSMVKREILAVDQGTLLFQNPFYEQWLRMKFLSGTDPLEIYLPSRY